jgi:signal transduction histidine kinase
MDTHATGSRHAIPALELLVEVLTGSEEDLGQESFYSNLVEAVCREAQLRRAVIFRYDDATRRVRAAGAHGIELETFADSHVSVETAPFAARALAEDRVIEVRPPAEHGVSEEFAGLVRDRPIVYVPIAAAGRWTGVILAEPEDHSVPLDEGRRELLWTLGKTLALASTARIATFHGERARQLEERIDLARDIHDRVVQRLFGVSLALSSSTALDEAARERCADELQTALADLRSALQRPLGRPARDTRTTLAAELERLRAQHPDLGLSVDGPVPEVPVHIEPLAQSLLAEAVRNVRKHADARELVVRVRREDGLFVLEVRNDGVAARARRGPPGMGLRLAALEAIHAGGVVEFGERQPGTWQVRLAVPEGTA